VVAAGGIAVDAFALAWWVWLLIGLALIAWELAAPGGFFLLFFGVGGVAVGLLDLLGVHLGWALQSLSFVAISLACIVLFRKPLRARFQRMPTQKVDSIVGETAQALEDIPVDGIGKAELRGSSWSAHNIGGAPITRSTRCRVERVEGLTLHVRG
jgi:membrane protein implicated in regulation of membrane protease activity